MDATHLAAHEGLDEGGIELRLDRDPKLVLHQRGEVVLKVRATIVLDDVVPTVQGWGWGWGWRWRWRWGWRSDEGTYNIKFYVKDWLFYFISQTPVS